MGKTKRNCIDSAASQKNTDPPLHLDETIRESARRVYEGTNSINDD